MDENRLLDSNGSNRKENENREQKKHWLSKQKTSEDRKDKVSSAEKRSQATAATHQLPSLSQKKVRLQG
jgi:hypothetical protein